MKRVLVLLFALTSCATAPENAELPETVRPLLTSITSAEIQEHVDHLASDEFAGRHAKSAEGRLAASYVAQCFERYGLEPLGDDGFFQTVRDGELAPNVIGSVPGTGPGFVLVTAHYDHLGVTEWRGGSGDKIYNGADDNASGTAVVLELAQAFGGCTGVFGPTLVFIAFTGEELGLVGSRHFIRNAPMDLGDIVGVINLDMVSRGREDLIFCEGGPGAPRWRDAADRAALRVGLEVRHDEHPEWRGSSDHAPFMQRGIPTLYFGVENHEDYHMPTDHSDRILPVLAARVARLVCLAIGDVTTVTPKEQS